MLWIVKDVFKNFPMSVFYLLTYKGTSTSFHPANEVHPTCKILFAIVWEKLNVYVISFLSINGPVDVAIILNK